VGLHTNCVIGFPWRLFRGQGEAGGHCEVGSSRDEAAGGHCEVGSSRDEAAEGHCEVGVAGMKLLKVIVRWE
jgi:hypothetical protein